MNRNDKRKFEKELKAKGYKHNEIEKMILIKEIMDNKKYLQEGQKVKLNLDKIKSHPDYNKLTEKYKIWVEDHKDDIFTVTYDKKYQINPVLVCLEEDENIPRWLFYEGELTVIK